MAGRFGCSQVSKTKGLLDRWTAQQVDEHVQAKPGASPSVVWFVAETLMHMPDYFEPENVEDREADNVLFHVEVEIRGFENGTPLKLFQRAIMHVGCNFWLDCQI